MGFELQLVGIGSWRIGFDVNNFLGALCPTTDSQSAVRAAFFVTPFL